MRQPMVSRTVLVPIELYNRISTYAKTYDISWSAAVRRLVEDQLPVEEAFPFDGKLIDPWAEDSDSDAAGNQPNAKKYSSPHVGA